MSRVRIEHGRRVIEIEGDGPADSLVDTARLLWEYAHPEQPLRFGFTDSRTTITEEATP